MKNHSGLLHMLRQIRAVLTTTVEPRLADIDSKLDHLIELRREERRCCCQRSADQDKDAFDGGDEDVFPEN